MAAVLWIYRFEPSGIHEYPITIAQRTVNSSEKV
jgi:hypothetical protein